MWGLILVAVLAAIGFGMFAYNMVLARDGWRLQKEIDHQFKADSASLTRTTVLMDAFGELQRRKKELKEQIVTEPSFLITNELEKVNGDLLRVVRAMLALPHEEPLTGVLEAVARELVGEGVKEYSVH